MSRKLFIWLALTVVSLLVLYWSVGRPLSDAAVLSKGDSSNSVAYVAMITSIVTLLTSIVGLIKSVVEARKSAKEKA